jgi:hypothetical protein
MPTHAEPMACCGPLAVEPLNPWEWYGRGQRVTLSRTLSKIVARPPEFGEQTNEVLASWVLPASACQQATNSAPDPNGSAEMPPP